MSNHKYIVLRKSDNDGRIYDLDYTDSDPYDDDSVKSLDQMLHRTLSKIFHELRFTSEHQIKPLLFHSKCSHQNFIFNLILKREPTLGELLLKRSKLSLLWIVVLSGYQDSAELLVRYGADVNERCSLYNSSRLTMKSTVLHAVVQMYPSAWNERFINLVVDHGADLKARDYLDGTVLHMAVRKGRVKVTEMLLKRGAEVNAVNNDGSTPLLYAARTNEAEELVPLLMRYGADIHAKDISGYNVLGALTGAAKEYVNLAKVLIEKGVSPREIISNHYQPIHTAARNGKIQLANLFLDHGADVNARSDGNTFPLYIAAQECDNPAMLLTLLKRGADICLRNKNGATSLHGLFLNDGFGPSRKNVEEKIKILLSVGLDMFAVADNGLTPFDLSYRTDVNYTLTFLKVLALKKAFLQPTIIDFEDERIVGAKYPKLWPFYQNCIEEINLMKSMKFIESCTIFDVLTRCQCQIAPLMRYRQIRFYDFTVFPQYAEDIVEALNRAGRHYQSMLDQEKITDVVFGDILPYMVSREIARYATNCEICEIKKIMRVLKESGKQKLNGKIAKVRYTGPYRLSYIVPAPIDLVTELVQPSVTTDKPLNLSIKNAINLHSNENVFFRYKLKRK